MFIKPVFSLKSKIALKLFFKELENTLASLSAHRLNKQYETGTSSLGLADYRHVLTAMANDETLGSSPRNAVLNACFKAEHTAAGAGIMTAVIMMARFKELVRHRDINSVCPPMDDISQIFKHSRYATVHECFEIIQRYIQDAYTCEMLLSACNMAGGAGQLFLDYQGKNFSSLLLQDGYRFPIGTTKEIIKTATGKSIELYDVDVLMIDGIIESVGEIHHILEEYSKTRRPIVVFARGFSEEVIATVAVNRARGALNLVPVQVPYDVDGINMLNDIAVICNSDLVSSLKGQLISSISIDEISAINKIVVNEHSVVLYAGNRATRVRAHIGELLTKRNESRSDDSQRMIDRRIQQLSPRSVHIHIGPEHGDRRGLLIDRVDIGIRMFKDISRDGIVDISNIDIKSECVYELTGYLKKFRINKVPARTLHASLVIGVQAAELLAATAIFLVNDDLHSE